MFYTECPSFSITIVQWSHGHSELQCHACSVSKIVWHAYICIHCTMHLLLFSLLVATLGDNGMCDMPLFESHRLETLCLGYGCLTMPAQVMR